jgi:hypothetical protein
VRVYKNVHSRHARLRAPACPIRPAWTVRTTIYCGLLVNRGVILAQYARMPSNTQIARGHTRYYATLHAVCAAG